MMDLQPKELRKYAKAALEQDWRIETTKKGYRFVSPDKTIPAVQTHKHQAAIGSGTFCEI